MGTKLHDAITGYQHVVDLGTDTIPEPIWNASRLFVYEADKTPHYVVDSDLIYTVLQRDPDSQLQALKEAGLMRLPYERLLLEVVHSSGLHEFFTFSTDETYAEDGEILLGTYQLFADGETGRPFMACVRESRDGGVGGLFDFGYVNGLEPKEEIRQAWVNRFIWAVMFVLLMQHVKGLAKEKVPAPVKLNKHRLAKGKREIPAYTSLYIGSVEDKDGKSHTYTGRTMPVHMRAGHTRRQHYGKGNALVKTVYIQPVLVNFNPGDDVPAPRRVVKMAS